MLGINQWDEMDYWTSKEWSVIQDRLDQFDREGGKVRRYNPKREDIFNALDLCPLEKLKVVLLGQDPYPDLHKAMGLAFSIPNQKGLSIPPSLSNIFAEYQADLGHPPPESGDLTKWAQEGVLLWNVIPTCTTGKPLSHENWTEWRPLTEEIVKVANRKGAVFILLGARAKEYKDLIDPDFSEVIEGTHPSPLARNSRKPFRGSRIFSTCNSFLCAQGDSPIDWRLD